jgi:hypothetical protein
LAARTLRLDGWSAGERLMAVTDPERWRTVVLANHIVQDNRDAITGCRTQARKSGKITHCTITINPDGE